MTDDLTTSAQRVLLDHAADVEDATVAAAIRTVLTALADRPVPNERVVRALEAIGTCEASTGHEFGPDGTDDRCGWCDDRNPAALADPDALDGQQIVDDAIEYVAIALSFSGRDRPTRTDKEAARMGAAHAVNEIARRAQTATRNRFDLAVDELRTALASLPPTGPVTETQCEHVLAASRAVLRIAAPDARLTAYSYDYLPGSPETVTADLVRSAVGWWLDGEDTRPITVLDDARAVLAAAVRSATAPT
jgi:hypothetical protein